MMQFQHIHVSDRNRIVEVFSCSSVSQQQLSCLAVTTFLQHFSDIAFLSTVEYWGSEVPVSQVGNVTLLDARTIGVNPFESNMAAKIEKAIRDSNLGLNPSSVGDLIRVPMPMLTEERRKDLIKVVRGEAEDDRVSIRNVRRDANDHVKKLLKDKEISEDEARRAEESVQKLTDKYIADVDKMLAAKEEDLMAI